MKKALLLLCFVCCAMALFARHSKGGYLVYQYLGPGYSPNTSKYKITVVHYVNCRETQFELENVYVGVFDGGTNAFKYSLKIPRTTAQIIQKQKFDGCINPVPEVCFFLAFYITTIELPDNKIGYTLAEQECCRAQNILNLVNSGEVGTTNFNTIPGVIRGTDYHVNSSPNIVIKDTAVICHNSSFTLDFGTTDPDGDELTYSFCGATSGGTRANRQPNPPDDPPYPTVNYASPYMATLPLGKGVNINEATGLIKGIAPARTGNYTVSVCITEWRNGVAIAVTKKEILVTVADCSLSAATLEPLYVNCDNYTFTFANESYANDVTTYLWDFGTSVSDPGLLTDPTPTVTYRDTGTYPIKLKVTNGSNCTDSATSLLKIYPGFAADFSVSGSCFQSPFQFTDKSYAKYGTIDYYKWDLGDAGTQSDTTHEQNPSHQYAQPGTVKVSLVVASDKGCRDTTTKLVVVSNKPSITLPFTDTLICRDDRLQIPVKSSGSEYSWSPAYNISDTHVSNPTVYPFDTTTYNLVVRDKQCIDSVQLTVNVIDSVTLQMPANIELCATDTVLLQPFSNALYYHWEETGNGSSLSNTSIKNPVAKPLQNTSYKLMASVGHCGATGQTDAFVSPYPTARVNRDLSICFGAAVQLHAQTTASHFVWSPSNTLQNANTLNPLAGPQTTTQYVLSVNDTFHCKKTVSDSVLVRVVPLPHVDAGNDTTAVINQPLQLLATSDADVRFTWTPTTGMYANDVYNPVIIITNPVIRSLTYFVKGRTALGCSGSDSVHVKVYDSKPNLFIPSAFTPDGNGRNEIFRPILVGISSLRYFRVFNRAGELLYQTTKPGEGWDGNYKGRPQPPGTYVFMASGEDYTGKPLVKQGTVVLIR